MSEAQSTYSKVCPLCAREFDNPGNYRVHFWKNHEDAPWRDEEILVELYHGQELSTAEIGDKLGCAHNTVSKWMKRHDIESRSNSEIWQIVGHPHEDGRHDTPEKLLDETWLYDQYHSENKFISEIANDLDCDKRTVSRWMDKHGIEKRSNSEMMRVHRTPDELRDENWLRREYVGKGRTTTEIGEEVGCTHHTVAVWIRRYGIEERNWCSGEDHRFYAGGGSFSYGPGWRSLADEIRERDNRECQECGVSGDLYRASHDQSLHVHHIKPLREFEKDGGIDYSKANDPENLITLCMVCHNEAEGRGGGGD